MKAFKKVFGWTLVVVPALVGLSAVGAWVEMLLWNYGVVGAFGAPELAFGHAWALVVLLGLNAAVLKTS